VAVAFDLDAEAAGDEGWFRVVAAAATSTAGPGRWGNEVAAEQPDHVGVVVQAEHELAAGFVDAGAAADHLVKDDGGFQVAEEHDVAHAGRVHPGGKQVDGGGDEPGREAAAQVGHHLVAAAQRGALEGVGLGALPLVGTAPVGIAVVQVGGDAVGMGIRRAEDDGFLLRSAGFQQVLEQIVAHGDDPLGDLQFGVVVVGVVGVADFAGLRTGAGIDALGLVRDDFLLEQTGFVDADPALLDFAGGEVAVLDALRQRVFVHRFAEVADVVGADLQVFLGAGEFARSGGEADLEGVRIAGEDFRPGAPGRAVAFVDDDVTEVVLRVMPAHEGGVAVFVDAQGLVGGDVDARVLGRVAAVRVLAHDLGVGAEHIVEADQGLLAQFVAIHQEQRALQLAGV